MWNHLEAFTQMENPTGQRLTEWHSLKDIVEKSGNAIVFVDPVYSPGFRNNIPTRPPASLVFPASIRGDEVHGSVKVVRGKTEVKGSRGLACFITWEVVIWLTRTGFHPRSGFKVLEQKIIRKCDRP
jgi:hypothetical protein